MLRAVLLSAALVFISASWAGAQTFPPFADLKPIAELPDPLTTLAGKKITTSAEWESVRRPELKQLVAELGNVRGGDSRHAMQTLDWTMRPPEEAILATAHSLIERGIVKL